MEFLASPTIMHPTIQQPRYRQLDSSRIPLPSIMDRCDARRPLYYAAVPYHGSQISQPCFSNYHDLKHLLPARTINFSLRCVYCSNKDPLTV